MSAFSVLQRCAAHADKVVHPKRSCRAETMARTPPQQPYTWRERHLLTGAFSGAGAWMGCAGQVSQSGTCMFVCLYAVHMMEVASSRYLVVDCYMYLMALCIREPASKDGTVQPLDGTALPQSTNIVEAQNCIQGRVCFERSRKHSHGRTCGESRVEGHRQRLGIRIKSNETSASPFNKLRRSVPCNALPDSC